MESFVATVEEGVIHVGPEHPLSNGRRVLVIALPTGEPPLAAAPQELLDEDAREFVRKRDQLVAINEKALR